MLRQIFTQVPRTRISTKVPFPIRTSFLTITSVQSRNYQANRNSKSQAEVSYHDELGKYSTIREESEIPRKRLKRNISFSARTFSEVRKLFGVEFPKVDDSKFPSAKKEDLKRTLDEVKMELQKQAKILRATLGSGNEATRCIFIYAIITPLMLMVNNLHVNIEFPLIGSLSQGPVDYVISANTVSELPIVCVVEAKKDDFDQGRAQCYMELFTAGEMNQKSLNIPLYGVITNSLFWYFVKYDPKKYDSNLLNRQAKDLFLETSPFMISTDDGLMSMLQCFAGILMEQDNTVKNT